MESVSVSFDGFKALNNLSLYIDAVQGFTDIPITNREWYCKGVGLVKVERDEPLNSMLWSGGKITMALTEYKLP